MKLTGILINTFDELDKIIYNQHVKNLLGEFFNLFMYYSDFSIGRTQEYVNLMLKFFKANNIQEFQNLSSSLNYKYTYGLNKTKDLNDFYLLQHYLENSKDELPLYLEPKLTTLTPFGLCYTY